MSFSPTNRYNNPEQYEVRFAPGIYEKVCASVGALEPEHYAILGGSLDDPLRVTDFMPMPPMMDHRGAYRSSYAAVTLNGPFIEYYLNTSLIPFGKYFLGVMHSHPGGMNHLSNGIPGSGQGDIPSMRGHLEAAARYGEPWHNFIAPIVTYPGTSPRVDTWIVRLDTMSPIPARTVWETAKASPEYEAESEIDEILDLIRYRPDLVQFVLNNSDRLPAFLRSHRARDERQGRLALERYLQRQARR